MKRLLKKQNHADILSGHISKLYWAVEVFQIQQSVDIAAGLEADRIAREADKENLERVLENIVANDARLEESLQLGFEGTTSRMAEIR